MKRILPLMVAAIVAFGASGSASAGVLGNYLNFGQINIVRDNSVGVLFDADGNSAANRLADPQVGDILQGIFKIDSFNNDPDIAGASLWGIYSLEVDQVGLGTFQNTISLKPITSGPNSIAGILSDLGLALPPHMKAGSVADATIALVEANVQYALPAFDGGFTSSLASAINPVEWATAMLLGFVEPTDFHEVRINEGGEDANYRLATTVIADNLGSLVEYGEVSGQNQFTTGTPSTSQFVGVSNLTITLAPPAEPVLADWHFSDKGDFAILPTVIPEPSTLAVWAILGVACGLAFGRRGKRGNSVV